jgi:hypothetical protein
MERRRAFAAAWIFALGCSTSSDDGVGHARCIRLRDHLIELRLQSLDGVDVGAHREAFQRAMGDEFATSCERSMTVAQLDCLLSSSDGDAAGACRHP